MATTYDEQIEEEIPGTFFVFSILDAEEDEERNAVVSSLEDYELPGNVVQGETSSGGVCAYALLNVLKQNKNGAGKKKKKPPKKTWADALEAMQAEIRNERGLDTYTPTLSTSRPTDLWSEPMQIASSSSEGVKRALLIGLHYENDGEDDGDDDDDDDDDADAEDAKLSSCHDDIRKMRQYLIHEEGFEPQNILVAMDDNGRHHEPTKEFILECVVRLCEISESGDSIFFHFSGHGGRLLDEEEDDDCEIPHELLAPSDYRKGEILTNDELYSSFVREVPAGVHVVAIIDTCHPSPSGCAMELPYVCEAGDDEVRDSGGFRSARAIMATVTAAAGTATVASKKKKKGKDVEKKGKQKKKTVDSDNSDNSDDESENGETEDENDEEESSQSEKGKTEKKPNKKKQKKDEEEEEAEEMEVPNDMEESSQSEKGKPEKKSKKKKKKKGDEEPPPKEEEASEEQEEDEKPKKKKKEDKKKKKSKKQKDVSNSSDDVGSEGDDDPPEQAPKKKKKEKEDAPKKKKKTKKK